NSLPTTVSGLTDVIGVSAGVNYSVALKSDGSVWTWGDNTYGQLGASGVPSYSSFPVRVKTSTGTDLTDIYAISAGSYSTYALGRDGTVWAWGRNDNGQLGDGTTTQRPLAVHLSSLANVTAIAAGGSHCLAVIGGS